MHRGKEKTKKEQPVSRVKSLASEKQPCVSVLFSQHPAHSSSRGVSHRKQHWKACTRTGM